MKNDIDPETIIEKYKDSKASFSYDGARYFLLLRWSCCIERSSDVKKKQTNIVDLYEIGSLATWSLSSWKPGNDLENLRDDELSTYWQ